MKTLKLLLSLLASCLMLFSCNKKEEKSWIDRMEEQKSNAPEWARYYVWEKDTMIFLKTFYDLQYMAVAENGIWGLTWGTVNQDHWSFGMNFPPPITKEEAEAIRRIKFPERIIGMHEMYEVEGYNTAIGVQALKGWDESLACECGNKTFTHRHTNMIECTACYKIRILNK